MTLFETCVKLAAYLVCIGVALEFSHRLYWWANERIYLSNMSTLGRSMLGTLAACIPLACAIGITAIFVIFIDKTSLVKMGLNYDGMSLTRVSIGAAIALGCVTVVFLFGVLLGFIHVRPSKVSEDCVSCMPLFLGGLADFFTAALFEEVIFRGYVFYLLDKAFGVGIAIFASAIIFSTAHLIKHSNVPVMYILNAFLFGLLVAYCRHSTGTLWLPIGLHFGWNVVSGPIFGLPYSGKDYDRGVVISEVTGPAWLTGGRYSLDAGILGTIAIIIAAIGLTVVTPIG